MIELIGMIGIFFPIFITGMLICVSEGVSLRGHRGKRESSRALQKTEKAEEITVSREWDDDTTLAIEQKTVKQQEEETLSLKQEVEERRKSEYILDYIYDASFHTTTTKTPVSECSNITFVFNGEQEKMRVFKYSLPSISPKDLRIEHDLLYDLDKLIRTEAGMPVEDLKRLIDLRDEALKECLKMDKLWRARYGDDDLLRERIEPIWEQEFDYVVERFCKVLIAIREEMESAKMNAADNRMDKLLNDLYT